STFTLVLPVGAKDKASHTADASAPPASSETSEPVDEIKNSAKTAPDNSENIPDEFIPDDRDSITKETKSILIIEDDPAFSKILLALSKRKGYLCLAARDGHSGLVLARKFQPNAIILDLGLPDVDGSQVLDQLKFDLTTRHIPIHIVSGREETPEFKHKGAIGYLLKPADHNGLENIFHKISSISKNKIKNILIADSDLDTEKTLSELLGTDHVNYDNVTTAKEAKEKLSQNQYDCMILELKLPDVSGFDLLKQLKEENDSLPPVIVYTGAELTEEEHNDLMRYATCIVLKGTESPERLLDEISLFLHSIESDLPTKQKQVIQMLHNSEKILSNRCVLLVDDDVRNVFALSSSLEKHGLDIIVASNGKIALEKLNTEEAIELVIMDIMMPVMDGYEAMKQIRKDIRFKDLPIIALTAKAMNEDRKKCIEAGANDYIPKPLDVDKLISMMKVWLFK
ncbi:MAG: response regulator, partial [Candidatus Cloacimonetes bacterium]|nr:response regulator [Candidatus Cloacimonadota bacterium]